MSFLKGGGKLGKEEDLIFIFMALIILVVGGAFLQKYPEKKPEDVIDWDEIIFKGKADEKLRLKANKFIFVIWASISALIFINTLLHYFFNFKNISVICIFIIILVWPIRLMFIYCHLRKTKE